VRALPSVTVTHLRREHVLGNGGGVIVGNRMVFKIQTIRTMKGL
jgi:hypothetical protein